jgi:hypothetical protein
MLPHGASTKNAGLPALEYSEIIDDLKSHSEEEVYQLVTKRWKATVIKGLEMKL